MAPFSRLLLALLLGLLAREAKAVPGGEVRYGQAQYSRVFVFGDSLSDTGNAAILPATAGGSFTQPPYGETYFHRPSGRASDGRLVIDFIVESLGLMQPTPYLAGKTAEDFRYGANFAVGGATALDQAFLKSRGITSFVQVAISNETSWFKNVLPHPTSKIASSSVFYFGEMGFNDYSFALSVNSTSDLAASLVPQIVGVIRSAVQAVIAAGARTVVVAGMLPIGCEPEMLTLFPGKARGYYDRSTACIARFNRLAELHNRALNRMLRQLRRAHRRTALRYGDLYRPITAIVASPGKYGFDDKPLAACCGGGGGPYNFNFTFFCGTPLGTACTDPSAHLSWDGIHYTEAANRFVARAILRGL